MKHKRILVMTLILGMSMQRMKVVTSAVEIEEEVEHQEVIVQSQVRIPVQGYIVSEEIQENQNVAEQPNDSMPLVEKKVREIPNTTDVGKSQLYIVMFIVSVLYMVLLWRLEKEERLGAR